jgi:hypothetical protein
MQEKISVEKIRYATICIPCALGIKFTLKRKGKGKKMSIVGRVITKLSKNPEVCFFFFLCFGSFSFFYNLDLRGGREE